MIQTLRDNQTVQSVLQSIGEGIVIVDTTGTPRLWNARAEGIVGLESLRAEGGWLQRPGVLTGEGIPLPYGERPLAKALEGFEIDGAELLVQASGGRIVQVMATARPLRDEAGKLVGAVAIFREVTEERRRGHALKDSERLYRNIAHQLPSTAIVLFDRELRVLLAPEGATAAGWTSGDIEGKRVGEVASPIMTARCEAALEGEPNETEVEQASRVHRVQFAPVRDDTGAIFAGLAVSTDVTAERRAAQELREAEEQFRLTIDHAPIGMALVGLDGRWLRVNHALCEIVGYTRDELLATTYQAITHADDLAADVALADRLLRGEIPSYRLAKRYIRKDGRAADTTLHTSLVCDENGKAMHFIAQIEDMTERKQLEAHLILTDRMASLGTLAAGVAHEINNPLTYVTSNLELLGEQLRELSGDVPSAPFREMFELLAEARDGAERVRKIVRGLKTLSRADDERRAPQELPRILDVAANLTMNEIRHRAILHKEYGPAPLVDADAARLTQVFINLFTNAAQAIPEGHAGANRITVTTSTDGEGRAVIEIRDTGLGIAPEVKARMFDPFFTTKPVGEGTGLGLAICHGIVKANGGDIGVESTLGQGAVFRVTLPPSRASSVAPLEGTRLPSQRSPPAHGDEMRVLIVDDDPFVGKAVKRALGTNHQVTFALNGLHALEELRTGPAYDVILCDLMMPEMTGMELHATLLLRAPDLATRMIFLTGGAFTAGARDFLESVPNPRLEKPFDLRNLRALVQGYRRPHPKQ